jgi:arsenite methyltransferase
MQELTRSDEVREAVARAYGKAVSGPAAAGCCAGPSRSALVELAGYGAEEIGSLPAEASGSSFGCGNPLALAEVREGDVVLDLGSGAGLDLILAARKVGPAGRAIGVDMTEAMVARARENIARAGLSNAEVRRGIIEALPVEAASVDRVISNCVINLSPEKEKAFAEIARVLRPGGRLLISDIVVEELPERLRGNEALHAACVGGAVSEREYIAGIASAGLEEVEVLDRLIYDESQLEALLGSGCACGGDIPGAGELAAALSGKVWSARFSARKPRR